MNTTTSTDAQNYVFSYFHALGLLGLISLAQLDEVFPVFAQEKPDQASVSSVIGRRWHWNHHRRSPWPFA